MNQHPLTVIAEEVDETPAAGQRLFEWDPNSNSVNDNKTCGIIENGSGEGLNIQHTHPCSCSVRYCGSCYHEIPDESLVKNYVNLFNTNNLSFWQLITWKNLVNALPLSLLFFIAINILISIVKFLLPTYEPEIPFYVRWYVSLLSAIKELYFSD